MKIRRNEFTLIATVNKFSPSQFSHRPRSESAEPTDASGNRRPVCRCFSIAALLVAVLTFLAPANASQTDIAPAPLGTAPSVTVLPNLMFILDNSTSMRSDSMPDEVNDSNTCKECDSGSCKVAQASCSRGDAPYFAAQYNTIYYNPQITYTPGVDSLGVSLGSANPTAINDNIYLGGSNDDVVNDYKEVYFCTKSSPSSSERKNSSICRRNGIDTPNPFVYKKLSNGDDMSGGLPTTKFRYRVDKSETGPYYYEITPREYCTDERLQTCSFTLSSTYAVPAPVRWCKSEGDAANTTVVSDSSSSTSPKCQSKVNGTYKYPRLGWIKRTDIKPSTPTYGNRPNRGDCAAAPTCTYAEELQNFANWYMYYRTRALLMKTSAGLAFTTLDERFRVGFVAINVPDNNYYLKIDQFTPAHKQAWYDKFYKSDHISGTPLKEALSRVGRHYAGVTSGINSVLTDDPVQYSCQQNYALLTTDGYYNSDPGQKIDGTDVGNQDNSDSGYSLRAVGAYDGNLSGADNSLADVAMYYYKTDLRPSMKDNVPTTAKDTAPHQHMVTFTLGMGLDGLMTYRPDYETALTGDFAKIKNGDPSGCSWKSGTCNWPVPKSSDPTSLDDLWHAAVNGRGRYFSAKDPTSLQSGLTEALSTIKITTGAAASSATSTPNITPTDNYIFSSTYRTAKWDGEVVAERIDSTTGDVIPGIAWSAGGQLNLRVSLNSDTRKIYTFTTVFANNRKDFLYANMSIAQRNWFDNKCASLPQCPSMSPVDQARVNNGDKLIDWLRGQSGDSDIYRARENVLGDTVNSKPAYVAAPILQYADAVSPDYASFKAANANRQGVLYIGANDGMLHAFHGDTGQELWAWVPRMIWPELHKLAVSNYDATHRYFVDGSPVVMDVFFKSQNKWKTVLVSGLRAGGRGFFALDITDPLSPKGLWEVCADPTGQLECTAKDDNIGLSFGDAIITKWDKTGDWVAIVSSGYNNVSPGNGEGHVFVIDIETGAILDQQNTGVGDTTTPSGLAHLSGFAVNFAVDNTATFVYSGDLLGNVWRLDTSNMNMKRIAQLFDGSSPAKPQSVTTRVDITQFDAGFRVIYAGTGRLLGASDLGDPALLSPPENRAYQQTIYAFKDTGGNLGDLRQPAANLQQQTITVVDATTRTISNNAVDWSTQNGWYVDLNPANQSPGERVTIDPQLVRGVLLVATNEPNTEPCAAGGNSWAYQFDYHSGSYVASASAQVVGTKLSSALVAGVVVYRLPSGQMKYSAIDVTGKKTIGGINPGGGGALGKRVSWRELTF